jgi:hypothetical protein
MADLTLARLQKDYLGYVDYYAEQLEQQIGRRTVELAPAYHRLQEQAVKYYEKLEKKIAKASDAKRMSKRFQKQIQGQYLTQLLPDLELVEAMQQPYFTEVVAGTLRYGYYTSAYSLEMAARIPITVPLLNRAGVLGLIANPWISDKKTYSDRIRANTRLVATKTTATVKDVVVKKLSYNEAARKLAGQIDESYGNAVRLLRTEMTRANALGASFAAMENADILDGKYRDATFDKRTSPYCAADAVESRKNLYDLDYDTPANPGFPGHRIPNHPHCRCRWYFVLSTLGVRDYGKVARKNDTRNSFGDSYRTDADTYDDYAKERGLPSVAEMLEKDNPARYLRPGETVDSLNRQVVRRTFNGQTITAAKAPWDTVGVEKSAEMGIIANSIFTPAKTVKDATAWGQANLGIDYVDYAGFDVRVANDVNETLQKLRNQFPQVTDTKYVATSQTLCAQKYADDLERCITALREMGYDESYARKVAAARIKRKKVPGSTYAWSTDKSWGKYEGVTFNKKWASNYDDFLATLKNDVAKGWHPVGADTPASVLTHEFGHQVDNLLKAKNARSWVDPMFADYRKQVQAIVTTEGVTVRAAQGRLLSAYANESSAEFFAEAFAEWLHNPNPRPIARAVGEKLLETMKGL